MTEKVRFKNNLINFLKTIESHVSTDDGQWTIKGFIDIYKNIYTISSDTKIVSKILEIHLFPKILNLLLILKLPIVDQIILDCAMDLHSVPMVHIL